MNNDVNENNDADNYKIKNNITTASKYLLSMRPNYQGECQIMVVD